MVSDGRTIDEYATTFGIRTIRFDVDRGFLLNERPQPMLGTCNHLDFAGVGIALPDNLQAWRIAKLKEMGCQCLAILAQPALERVPRRVRSHGHSGDGREPPPGHRQRTQDTTRLGDLVVANFDELHSMLLRDRNHPSIVLWSLCNEEPHIPTTTRNYKILKEEALKFDKTRPFTGSIINAKGDSYEADTDVIGLNYAKRERFDDAAPEVPGQADHRGGIRQFPHGSRGLRGLPERAIR